MLTDAILLDNNNRHGHLSNGVNSETILINNLTDGEVIAHSIIIIRGKAPSLCSYINIRDCKNRPTEWPVIAGEFRIIYDLKKGINKIELDAGGIKRRLTLIHEPRVTRQRVTPVYVICAGHDGYFQGPKIEEKSPESAATRIGIGARLLQCLTAEKLRESGHGRKTFQLERDIDGPECLVMHSVLHVDKARSMSQRELWEFIGRELMTGPLASRDRKYMAFLSCTRYEGSSLYQKTHESMLSRTQGHAALGGGGLALFGSACLHTWPTCLEQVIERFLDKTIVNTDHLMDDSNYRGTHGGCLATTLGSVLHELGHTFDLGHTREGIMGRGFDYVDRVFIGGSGIDTNRNPIKRDPQHTMISLTRPLSVTVTVQASVGHPSAGRRGRLLSETTKSTIGNNENRKHSERLSAPASPVLNRSFSRSLTTLDYSRQSDRTFWGPSCSAILAYHRWFNCRNDNLRIRDIQEIQYDGKRYENVLYILFILRTYYLISLNYCFFFSLA